MSGVNVRLYNSAPLDYTTPRFPSLYYFVNTNPGVANYLYYATDIWRFTLLWTLIIFAGFHMVAAAWAMAMQFLGGSATRYTLIIPVVYALIGGIEALLAGSFVGLVLGAVYNAGYFSMSTWIPFVWSLINVLFIVISSFSYQGAL